MVSMVSMQCVDLEGGDYMWALMIECFVKQTIKMPYECTECFSEHILFGRRHGSPVVQS